MNIDINKFMKETADLLAMESPSDYPKGVKNVANFFKGKFEEINWNTELISLDERAGPNLKVTNTHDENYDILIVGHMDTVFPLGTVKGDPIRYEGDRAYGSAIGDMKSNILLNYYVCKEISKLEDQPKICVFYNSDEEISSRYSKDYICELAKKSKMAIVIEGARANGSLVSQRKGISKYIFTVKGKAVHAGTDHEKGLNSIDEFCGITKRLHAMTNYDLGTTLNVGVVKGGTKSNVVPENTYAELDIRYREKSEIEKIRSEIASIIEDSKSRGFQVEFKENGMRPPMNPSDATKKLMKVVEDIGKNLGMDIAWASSGGGSDANFTADSGIPSLDGFGPISANSHSTDEYIDLTSIEPMGKLLFEVIKASKNLIF